MGKQIPLLLMTSLRKTWTRIKRKWTRKKEKEKWIRKKWKRTRKKEKEKWTRTRKGRQLMNWSRKNLRVTAAFSAASEMEEFDFCSVAQTTLEATVAFETARLLILLQPALYSRPKRG